jgi:hypothetical protein
MLHMITNFKRAIGPVLVLAAVGVAAPGCGDELNGGGNQLCCNDGDIQVGGTISADAEYSAEMRVTLQAVADIAGIASASVSDLETACRSMAEQLDAPKADRDAAQAIEDKTERMQAYCSVAVQAIASFKGSATITAEFAPPECSASVSASADCNAGCQVDAACDASATPPTCEGGKMTVSCQGSCSAEAGASIQCQGTCTGSCEGSCTAEGGVECAGKCDGTCEASAEGGGSGIQADGTCDGVCKGTCEVTAPNVQCEGSCNGSCDASCEAEAGASVTCDGSCEGEVEPLKCEGGELKASCEVDAECSANCDASVKAKAECTPPEVRIVVEGAADANVEAKLKAVLEANIGVIAALEARFSALGDALVTVSGNVNADALAEIKVACIPVVVAALTGAVTDVEATVSASGSILGQVGG